MKILSIFGTRPEAIKMAPLVLLLANIPGITAEICVTGQHRTMLRNVLNEFGLVPDYDLDVMVANQSLNGLTSRLFSAVDDVLRDACPDRVLVHGDTSTGMASALAAFHSRIPVAHVEAGLRTGRMGQPWPEEMNRRVIDSVSDLLFAPTASAKENLARENLQGQVFVTGNTGIDALNLSIAKINADPALQASLDAALPILDPARRLLVVTGHRRENFGEGFRHLCKALQLLAKRSDIEIVYPVHLNPNVQEPVNAALSGLSNVHLIAPLGYLSFLRLLQRSHVILTDSGGVQEEAPSLGKPVLVTRTVTERPEALSAGKAILVGTDFNVIVDAVARLFDDDQSLAAFHRQPNPYGDGHASERILCALTGLPFTEFGQPPGMLVRAPAGTEAVSALPM